VIAKSFVKEKIKRVQRFKVQGSGFRVQVSRFRVQVSRFKVQRRRQPKNGRSNRKRNFGLVLS
jgi:hypothetical protein